MGAVKYWEDLAQAPVRRFGPVVFDEALLDQLLDLMGEKHPVHDSDSFAHGTDRRRRIVPGGFIHSITSGWVVQHGSPAAIVGMRRMSWDFVRPLYPDTPFWFTTATDRATPIDDRLGLIDTTRRVFDENDRTYAIGRMSVVLLRRATVPGAEPTTPTATSSATSSASPTEIPTAVPTGRAQ